jgi:hypothetical protein
MQLALSRCGHSTRSLQLITRHLAMQTSGITSNVLSSRSFLYLQPTSTKLSSFDRPRLLSVKAPNDIRPMDPWIEKAEQYPAAGHQNGTTSEGSGIVVLPDKRNTATLPLQTQRRTNFPRTHKTYFGMTAGWLLRHTAKSLGYEVTPDGFVRVSDVVSLSFLLNHFFQVCSQMDCSLVFSISADIHLKDLPMPFIVTIASRWFSCQTL